MQFAAALGITLKRQKRERASFDPDLPPELQSAKPLGAPSSRAVDKELDQQEDELSVTQLPPLQSCLRLSKNLRAMLSNNKFLWRDLNLTSHSHRITDVALTGLLMRAGDQVRSLVLGDAIRLSKNAFRAVQACRAGGLRVVEVSGLRKPGMVEGLVAALRIFSSQSMRRVNLSGCGVIDSELASLLAKCRGLEELVLQGCDRITDAGLDALVKVVIAHRKEVTELRDKDAAATRRSHPFAIKLVDVTGCIQLGDKFVHNLARCFPALECLLMAKLRLVTHRSLDVVALHCKGLTTLDATDVQFSYIEVPDNDGGTLRTNTLNTSILGLAKECKGLKSVRIAACKFVDDATIQYITALCPEIESLEFPKTANITNVSLAKIGNRCKFLKRLNLASCPQITDEGLEKLLALATASNDIAFLDVSQNSRITDKTLGLLTKYGCQLSELHVSGCGVTGGGVLAFARDKAEAGTIEYAGIKKGAPLKILNLDRCTIVGNETVTQVRAMLPHAKVSANL
ncbi:hypothetical protein BC830DRAFT_1157555 [Chytriomyces sp. MP71]|nr:hypothetical protein BC830DRAFT_1157555 [Chytriomyces sp. MP71]